ncbi:hypothetical protein ACSQ67_023571 [Phaseolus vulgaris]
MASKASPFLALVLISNILIATAVAGRSIAEKTNTQDKKEPQFLFKSHDRVYIPGIGPVGFPPKFHLTPHNPFTHGGDDTFVPNPGYEVPIPGSGGSVPAPIHP